MELPFFIALAVATPLAALLLVLCRMAAPQTPEAQAAADAEQMVAQSGRGVDDDTMLRVFGGEGL
ncbi:hypothetical protein GO986_16500 [Deinococcus sp. HMF7620]|uniref:Uncharacterized protein n=1 Tax=Deinococcus arboris TaxID=2682977 RepID=A0A7C9HTH5_9DEIO|nr:hypothetical protein [Deinococcus arboris]MVN88347.1 hypothetical protein [Deinococcus arboris]